MLALLLAPCACASTVAATGQIVRTHRPVVSPRDVLHDPHYRDAGCPVAVVPFDFGYQKADLIATINRYREEDPLLWPWP